jgi:hypothetical protein
VPAERGGATLLDRPKDAPMLPSAGRAHLTRSVRRSSGLVLEPQPGPIPSRINATALPLPPALLVLGWSELPQIVVFAWRKSSGANGALRRPKIDELSRRFLLTEICPAPRRILGLRAKGLAG